MRGDLRGDPLPLQLVPGSLGWGFQNSKNFWNGCPGYLVLGKEELPLKLLNGVRSAKGEERRLATPIAGKAVPMIFGNVSTALGFSWPLGPAPGATAFCLSVETTKGSPWTEYQVEEEGGGFRVSFPILEPKSLIHGRPEERLLTFLLPLSMAPGSGAKLALRHENLLAELPFVGEIRRVVVRWVCPR
jgi:hypothetical protein